MKLRHMQESQGSKAQHESLSITYKVPCSMTFGGSELAKV